VVVVFNFAIGANPELIHQVAPGVLWVALLFATVLGLQRAVHLEGEEDCLQGVLLALGDRSALFVAKTVANMLYLLIVALCTLPLFSIWFRIDLAACFAPLCLVLLLGMLGFSTIGTLFSILTLNMRTREVMLPLLFYPVSVPLVIGSVYATASLIDGKSLAEITDYLTLIVVFDVVFVVLALLLFDYIVEE
jgi:heme exporter protein B